MNSKININIQILRGVSVLFVLLFHLDVNFFKFGYIGVDIFFLISGFLMPIILPKYSAFQFISARVKRLLPVLSIAILFTLLLGYLLLLPGEYLSLSLSAIAAFSFVSQFYFILNTGYFDLNAIYQPLLHTWSLGNEFLAYIFIFISLLFFPRRYMPKIVVFLALISFSYTVYILSFSEINYLDPAPRFFLFFIAFYISNNKEDFKFSDKVYYFTSIISSFAILYFFGENISNKTWPNFSIFILPFVILPLMMMKTVFLPNKFLSSGLSKIGDWSYSIYIWHWILICYERVYFRNANLSFKEMALLFFVSVFLGYISYRFLEKRKSLGSVAFVLSMLLCAFIYLTEGASYRTPHELSKYSSIEKMIDYNNYISEETIGEYKLYTIIKPSLLHQSSTLIVGDSHSRHILPIYKAGYKDTLYRLSAQPEQLNENWFAFKDLVKDMPVSRIVFTFRLHTKSSESIERLSYNLKESGFKKNIEIIFMRDIPSYNGDLVSCLFSQESNLIYKGCGFDIKKGIPLSKVHNSNDINWLSLTKNLKGTVSFIDTHVVLCNDETCKTMVNGEFFMRDSNHFNEKMNAAANLALYDIIFEENMD